MYASYNWCFLNFRTILEKIGHSVSHQFFFSVWQATLVARIQNANDVVNLNSACALIQVCTASSVPKPKIKQTMYAVLFYGRFLTKMATVLATSSISPVGERRW